MAIKSPVANLWRSLEHAGKLLKPRSRADDHAIGLDEVLSWIGTERYRVNGAFDVEQASIAACCASVQNGNPLYWDAGVADDITGGPTAPLTMLSTWLMPHYWIPGRENPPLPWQTHFDLQEALALPEAIVTDSEVTFGEPVRPGDRISFAETLRSLSEVKHTRLGKGRFWVIDCICSNQKGEWAGTETMTGFGYRKG